MTKDEYVKAIEKHMADKAVLSKQDAYYAGYFDGLEKAVDLAEKLDEPKKVVIPQFVADWIEEAKIYSDNEVDPLGIIYWMDDCIGSEPYYEWLKNIDNQKLLLNAIANGYEVEKEKKYRVKIKGISKKEEWLNCKVMGDIRYFELNTESEKYKTYFTKQWLKDHWSEYDAYNNAGLLEFEEVEDE
ncbi:DUF1642 domain-containing protein [Pediococcus pentosaceus]|uniref:DUF1642 domain-containing protein n=1 Tax=Pediococcus pentosaceus TaxID=1255 RepID=UPI00211A0372|nr:DUF1642 domain-containing protein [Pediococcus pentosaceus]MCQ9197080.1 DUF1642 domain-containing protein [Pediococcus pentosaceus]